MNEALKKSVEIKAYQHILLPLFLASILAFLDRVNISIAKLTMLDDLGFDAEIYGFGAGIFFAGYVLLEVPGAVLAERWSPSKWIARIMVSWGIVCVLMAFMTTPLHFYILRFLLGACEASLYPVIYASVIPRWFTAEARPKAISITLTSLLVAGIIGNPLAGWLVDFALLGFKGWQNLFLLEGGVTAIYGIIILFWLKDNPTQANWLTKEEKDYLINTINAENATKTKEKSYTFWQAITNGRVIVLCLIYFFWITGFWGYNFWVPTALKGIGLSSQEVGWVMVLPMSVALIAMVWIGHSATKHKESVLHVVIPLIIAAIGFLIGALSENPIITVVSAVVVAVGVYAPMGVWWTIPTTFLTGVAAAGAIGLINSTGNVGGFIGPTLLGFIVKYTGSLNAGYYWLSGSLLLSAILLLSMRNKKK